MDAMHGALHAETWNSTRHQWAPAPSPDVAPLTGTIVRITRQQRHAFWIAVPGGWLETDSEAWAFILGLGAEATPLGQIDTAGNCWVSPRLGRLPLPLVRWWMHWGGGCTAVAPSGDTVLACSSGADVWKNLYSWFLTDAAASPPAQHRGSALERRRLALRLRKTRQTTSY
jgi:hypothetical protein